MDNILICPTSLQSRIILKCIYNDFHLEMSEFESWIDDRRPRFASKHKDNGGEAEFMAAGQ